MQEKSLIAHYYYYYYFLNQNTKFIKENYIKKR